MKSYFFSDEVPQTFSYPNHDTLYTSVFKEEAKRSHFLLVIKQHAKIYFLLTKTTSQPF